MKIHRLAEYFPVLEGEEFDLLVEDIRKNGQREPVIMVDDEILDGVNRWRACEQLDRAVLTEQFQGDDPLAYVISLNVRRRHLDVSQRAALATEMLPEFERQARERKEALRDKSTGRITPSRSKDHDGDHLARDDAARMFGVSGPTVQRAKQIKRDAPEKFEEIKKGKATVTTVATELRQAEAAKRAAAHQEKQTGKAVKQEHHGVAEYFDALKEFRDRLRLTIEGSKRERWFAPESINIVLRKHNEIREMLAELEGNI